MLLKSEGFWEKEKSSCLFNRSGLDSEGGLYMMYRRARDILWLSKLSLKDTPKDAGADPLDLLAQAFENLEIEALPRGPHEVPPETLRIFELDAERTFKDEENKATLRNTLSLIYSYIGDYHQGEGFVIAFLLIYLTPSELVTVIKALNTNFLRGYFSSAPKNYVRDARVLMRFLRDKNPELHSHLEPLIVPEAFVSKWFIGLNIHVLIFPCVIDYIRYILKKGDVYLFQYGIAFFTTFQKELMKTRDISYILQVLRLEDFEGEKCTDACFEIIKNSLHVDLDVETLEKYRSEVEKEMEEEEQRKKANEALLDYDDDEIVFSDEE